MRIKLLYSGEGFEEGDIVEAKRFKDLTEEEKQREVNNRNLWDGEEIFAKRRARTDDGDYLYLYDEECEIIEE